MDYVSQFYSIKQETKFKSKYLVLRSSYPDANRFSIFLEGTDDKKFYKPYFKNFSNRTIDYIDDLQGKENVIGLYKYLVKQNFFDEYEEKFFLFFLDKDYDCFLNKNLDLKQKENIFITDFYSIENYFTQDTVIKEILSYYFEIEVESVKDLLLEEYKNIRRNFVYRFQNLTTLILAHKEKEMSFQNEINQKKIENIDYIEEVYPQFSLDKLNIEDFFYFNYDNGEIDYKKEDISFSPTIAIPDYYFSYFSENNGDLSSIDSSKFKLYESMLGYCPEDRIYLRGKFDLWFLLKYLNYVKSKNKRQSIKDLIVEYYTVNNINLQEKKTTINSAHNFTNDTIFTLISILVNDSKIENFINQNLN